jgi:hypothetical protein
MNEIYLAGSSGYIGNIAYKNLSKIFNVIPLTRSSSLEEFYSEILDKESNQILIYAAGNKNIKDCEGNFNTPLMACKVIIHLMTSNQQIQITENQK